MVEAPGDFALFACSAVTPGEQWFEGPGPGAVWGGWVESHPDSPAAGAPRRAAARAGAGPWARLGGRRLLFAELVSFPVILGFVGVLPAGLNGAVNGGTPGPSWGCFTAAGPEQGCSSAAAFSHCSERC